MIFSSYFWGRKTLAAFVKKSSRKRRMLTIVTKLEKSGGFYAAVVIRHSEDSKTQLDGFKKRSSIFKSLLSSQPDGFSSLLV